jgi:pimeloyl-ACP methyl ester carboxylesterase
MVFPPNHEVVNVSDAERKIVVVAGRKVECWVARSPGARGVEPQAFVLFFVGKGDRADRWTGAVAGAWGDKPVEVWGMNYPGSGGTEGNADITQVAPDALGVFDAAGEAAHGRPVFIHAGSFGTTAALSVAARRPVAGLVLQNPPPLRQLILGRYGWWNLWLFAGPVALGVPTELDSIANARKTTAPAVFILAGRDTTVPPEYQQKVVAAYAGERRIVEMSWATHDDPLSKEAAEAFAKDLNWLWSTVMLKPTTQSGQHDTQQR